MFYLYILKTATKNVNFQLMVFTYSNLINLSLKYDKVEGIVNASIPVFATNALGIVWTKFVSTIATSIGDHPPMPIIKSGLNSFIISTPFLTVATDGSFYTPVKTIFSILAIFKFSCILRTVPSFIIIDSL